MRAGAAAVQGAASHAVRCSCLQFKTLSFECHNPHLACGTATLAWLRPIKFALMGQGCGSRPDGKARCGANPGYEYANQRCSCSPRLRDRALGKEDGSAADKKESFSNLFGVDFGPSLAMVRPSALLAQLDRASDFDSEGREFESLGARHSRSEDSISSSPDFKLAHKIPCRSVFACAARCDALTLQCATWFR